MLLWKDTQTVQVMVRMFFLRRLVDTWSVNGNGLLDRDVLLVIQVLLVTDGHFLTLVPSQINWLSSFVGDGAFVATFSKERINRLSVVPPWLEEERRIMSCSRENENKN